MIDDISTAYLYLLSYAGSYRRRRLTRTSMPPTPMAIAPIVNSRASSAPVKAMAEWEEWEEEEGVTEEGERTGVDGAAVTGVIVVGWVAGP